MLFGYGYQGLYYIIDTIDKKVQAISLDYIELDGDNFIKAEDLLNVNVDVIEE